MEREKQNFNPSHTIKGGFELESILIIISCGLKSIEKRVDGLQVIHIAKSWN